MLSRVDRFENVVFQLKMELLESADVTASVYHPKNDVARDHSLCRQKEFVLSAIVLKLPSKVLALVDRMTFV